MRAGEHVTPQVRLVRPIGAGGMGSVWVADHLALKTQVAVKFILAGRENDSDARERFSREAEAAAQVKSPHVTQIFDHGVAEDGVPFIVMELLEGEDLSRHLAAARRLPLREASAIVTQVCRALSRAHAKGMIHRDVKPANIFLCDVGTDERFVKLLDFGVAKVAGGDPSTATKSGSLTGTPVYMAPEQLLGSRDLDHRADLWSVGVVTYELITGRRPFGEETAAAIALRVHTKGMPRASEGLAPLPEAASAAIDAFFAKAWSTSPAGRHESATAFAQELEALVQLLRERGVEETPPLIVPSAPRVSLDGNAPTVNELPTDAVASDRTLASGRGRIAEPAPISDGGAKPRVASLPADALSAPRTETPLSRHVRESGAPTTAPGRAARGRWSVGVAVFLAGLVVVAFTVGRRSAERQPEPPPAIAASGSVPVVQELSPAPSNAGGPSASAPTVTTGPVASAETDAATPKTGQPATVKKKTPPAPSTSASAPAKKKLEDIE